MLSISIADNLEPKAEHYLQHTRAFVNLLAELVCQEVNDYCDQGESFEDDKLADLFLGWLVGKAAV